VELGLNLLKYDSGRGIISGLFPTKLAEILLNGTTNKFRISYSEATNYQGWNLSCNREKAKDRRNINSTRVFISNPESKGNTWRFIPDKNGKHFRIVLAQDTVKADG